RVVAGVHGDAVQPRGEGGISAEPREVAVAGQERVLRGVAGVVRVPQHPVGQVVHAAFVALHQMGEGLLLALLEASDELRVRLLHPGGTGHEDPWREISAMAAANRPWSGARPVIQTRIPEVLTGSMVI